MDVLIAIVVVIGGLLAAAALVDRASRRRGHSTRGGGSIWVEEVREHRRDIRAGELGSHLSPDRSWTRERRRGRS
jgi:hypothetical protein